MPKFNGTRKEKDRIRRSITTGMYELIFKNDATNGLANKSRMRMAIPKLTSLTKIFFLKSLIFSSSFFALKLETYLVETSKIDTEGTDTISIKDKSEFMAPKSPTLKCRLIKNWKR